METPTPLLQLLQTPSTLLDPLTAPTPRRPPPQSPPEPLSPLGSLSPPPLSPFSPNPVPPPRGLLVPPPAPPGPPLSLPQPRPQREGRSHWQHPSTLPLADTSVTQSLPRSRLAAERRQSTEGREEGRVGGGDRPPEENSGRVVGGGAGAPHRPSFPPGLPQRHRGGLAEPETAAYLREGRCRRCRGLALAASRARAPASPQPGPAPPQPPPAPRTEISRDLRGGDSALGTNGGAW